MKLTSLQRRSIIPATKMIDRYVGQVVAFSDHQYGGRLACHWITGGDVGLTSDEEHPTGVSITLQYSRHVDDQHRLTVARSWRRLVYDSGQLGRETCDGYEPVEIEIVTGGILKLRPRTPQFWAYCPSCAKRWRKSWFTPVPDYPHKPPSPTELMGATKIECPHCEEYTDVQAWATAPCPKVLALEFPKWRKLR